MENHDLNNTNVKTKNKILMLVVAILSLVVIISGSTFARWSWQGNEYQQTSVVFSANKEFSCAVDGGGNITSSDLVLIPTTCTDSEHAIKREVLVKPEIFKNDMEVYMDLWLNVNSIGVGLANSRNFKYAFTTSSTSCHDGVISNGNFYGSPDGNKVQLLGKSFNSTINETYYLWIWLDEEETNIETTKQSFNLSLGGQCSDNLVGTQNVVSYHANGGTGAPNTQFKLLDNDLILSSVIPKRSQHSFVEWNTKSDGTGISYQPGDTYSNNENIVLYAIWEEETVSSIVIPTANTYCKKNIEYNGSLQTLTHSATEDYTFSNNTGTNAGDYAVVVALNSKDYLWSDGTSTEKTFTCSIAKKKVTIAARSQEIEATGNINTDVSQITTAGLISGHVVKSITLTASELVDSEGIITPSNAVIMYGNTNVTNNYNITYNTGVLTEIQSALIATIGNCNTLTYNGSSQTLASGGTGVTYVNNTATNAGTYEVTVNANNGYEFDDGTESKTLSCNIGKKGINAPTNVSVSTAGIVTWTASSNATGYQISIDGSDWENATSGVDYLSTIIASTGSRTVYVRAVNLDTTNYSTSSNATASLTVYPVTFNTNTVDGQTPGTLDVTSYNVISGATVSVSNNKLTINGITSGAATKTLKTITATNNTGYVFSSWSKTSGSITAASTIYANWTQDIDGPTYISYEFKNITSSGYDVYVYGVSDPSGVNRVQFPTWTEYNGQDELQSNWWESSSTASGTNQGNGTWYYRVNTVDHKGEAGLYNTHIYMYDNLGNRINIDTTLGSTVTVPGITITIESNNTSYGTVSASSVSVGYGAQYTTSGSIITFPGGQTISASTKNATGYTTSFTGWSSSSGTITSATTITANFSRSVNTYTVFQGHYYYDQNEDYWFDISSSTHTVSYGSSFTPSSVTPPTGYHVGASYDYYNSSYSPLGQKEIGTSFIVTENMYVHVPYFPNEYSVCYDANGGSGAPDCQTKTYGIDLTIPSTVPSREGYTFLGWSESNTATSESYDAGGTYTKNEGATLYAVWRANETKLSDVAVSPPACAASGQVCSAGKSITINVGGSENFEFKTLSDTGTKITLLSISSLGKTTWNDNKNDLTTGPTTLIAALDTWTSGWINIISQSYTIKDDANNLYTPITELRKARVVNFTEILAAGCKDGQGNADSCATYMAYWEQASHWSSATYGYYDGTKHPIFVNSGGWYDGSWNSDNSFGVRPVLELAK